MKDYKLIITMAVEQWKKRMAEVNPVPIGVVTDWYWKEYAPISHWLFWHWALLVKKQNRKFAKAMLEYCEENKMYCSYSDYHQAYYVWLTKSHEYERLQAFYSAVYYTLLGCNIPSKIISYITNLD